MKFEFDPAENQTNKAKHGVGFEEAAQLWAVQGVEATLGQENASREYRYARLARINGRVYVAIFTYRSGPAVRLISFRKASGKEIKIYEQHCKK